MASVAQGGMGTGGNDRVEKMKYSSVSVIVLRVRIVVFIYLLKGVMSYVLAFMFDNPAWLKLKEKFTSLTGIEKSKNESKDRHSDTV